MPGTAIWLASVPKSGNTWVRLMLRALQSETGSVALADLTGFGQMVGLRDWFDKTMEIESTQLTHGELLDLYPGYHDVLFTSGAPRLVKVHDAWVRTSRGEPAYAPRHTHAALYVMRDPRDAVVSWARFMGNDIDWAIEDFGGRRTMRLRPPDPLFTGLPHFVGNWSTHVTSWIDESGLAPLVLQYEAMQADPAGELARMAAHLDWPADPARIAAAVAATQFERLVEQERRDGFWEKPKTAERFFHTGQSGGWRDTLTVAQAARIERDHGAVMARFGYL